MIIYNNSNNIGLKSSYLELSQNQPKSHVTANKI